MVQAFVEDLGHVYQAVALTKEVHKGTKVDDLHNLTGVNFAFFWLSYDRIDHVVGFLDRFSIGRGNLDHAVVVDVDFCTRGFNDLTDHLTTGADHFTDLVGRDVHGLDARCMSGEFRRFGQCFCHLAQNVQAAVFCLCQSGFHDFRCDTCNLDVHLQAGDTCFGTGNFEVHVAQVVFVTQDVGQDAVGAVFFQNQTHCNTSNRRFQRNACVHHRQ